MHLLPWNLEAQLLRAARAHAGRPPRRMLWVLALLGPAGGLQDLFARPIAHEGSVGRAQRDGRHPDQKHVP